MNLTATTVPVGDIDISYSIVGEGRPLIALHGAIGLGSTYMRALDSWADDGFQVVTYDQRGSGATPLGDAQRVSFPGGLADLDGLRTVLGLDDAFILGHSAGAYLAALYGAAHPEVPALVLLNPGPPLAPDVMARFSAAMSARRSPEDNATRRAIEASPEFAAGLPEALERHQLNTFIPFFKDRSTVDRTSLGFTEITAANVRQAPKRMIGSLGRLEPLRQFADIRCPTLVVHSELDPIPTDWSRSLADTIPHADFALIEGGSHFSMLEDADQLRSTVVPWLRRLE